MQDLLAAVTFAVQPLDDLNLAYLLVSPLIGWDQEQLFDLAYGRERRRCGASCARAGEREDFAAAHAALGELLRDGRLHHAVALPRNDPVGPDRGPAQALFAGSAWRRATRSTS